MHNAIASPTQSPRSPFIPPRCLVLDDHPMTREGLASVLCRQPGWPVPAQAAHAEDALAILRSREIDLILTDLSFPGLSGLDWIRRLNETFPLLQVLVVSMHDARVFAPRVIRLGAKGYIAKESTSGELLRAIRVVREGGIYVHPDLAGLVIQQLAANASAFGGMPTDLLTDRELEVFMLLGQGLTSEEIASRMVISFKTVNVHRDNIKKKLNMKNSSQLIQQASRWVAEQHPGVAG